MRRIACCALLAAFSICGSSDAALIKSYDFDGGLGDTLGNGVALTASGGTISGGRYNFGPNQGLRLTSALPSTSSYGIEFRLRVDDSVAGWNKLIDFQDLSSDLGHYILNGGVAFWTLNTSPAGTVSVGTDVVIGFERIGGVANAYVNGALLWSIADGGNQAVSAGNIINFFEDDFATGQNEFFAGSVDWIRIHDDATTFGQATILPEPGSILVWSLLTAASLGYYRRRRRSGS